ncbi:T9SS type A sorting domain-containing protein [bacterium]|nr:T9SS type A sorting domain-containing protein [bacterium]
MRLSTFITLLCLFCTSYAQPPDTVWSRNYLDDSESSAASDIVALADGGFLVGGGADGAPQRGFLMRLNADGDTLWTRFPQESGFAWIWRVLVTLDGDYMFVGFGPPPGETSWYPAVGRYDSQGNEIWVHHYPDSLYWWYDRAFAICEAHDGGFIVGSMNLSPDPTPDISVFKIDDNGEVEWVSHHGGIGCEHIYDLIQVEDGYVGVGTKCYNVQGDWYIQLSKLDMNGDSVWTRFLAQSYESFGYGVVELPDGGFALTGYVNNDPETGTYKDIAVIKTDSEGEVIWERIFGGSGNDEAEEIVFASDSTIVICGHTSSTETGNNQAFVMSISLAGDSLWMGYYGLEGSDYAHGMCKAIPSGYAFCGEHHVPPNPVGWHSWVVRLAGPESVGEPLPLLPDRITLYQNYPNPFNAQTTIRFSINRTQQVTLAIYDILGKKVKTIIDDSVPLGWYELTFSAANLPSGIYTVSLRAGQESKTKKMVLLK